MQQSTKFRRPVFVSMLVIVAILAATMAAAGGSTSKSLSTNFTLVNLNNGSNTVSIQYFKTDGSQWRPSETANLPTQGAQVIRRQYEDTQLSSGSGSVVVGGSGPMGAVVQIQARSPQVPTSGAYSGATAGALTANIPLVAKNGSSGSGVVNSQVIVQNTGGAATTYTVAIVDQNGATVKTTAAKNLLPGASDTYDLADDTALAAGFYSAVVTAGSGGQIAAVSNLFTGPNGMQTFSGFNSTGQKWVAPIFFSKLGNGLSTPITVQNLHSTAIPANAIKVDCVGLNATFANFQKTNPAAVNQSASVFFNPVGNAAYPDGWVGSCTIDTTGYETVAFVQMRFVGTDKAAAYEAIKGNGTKVKNIVPLYMKRLGNGFATAVNIQNLGTQAATVDISYKQGDGAAASCNVNLTGLSIPVGGSLIQNHRIESGPNSVPTLPNGCFGSMVVTSTNGQAIESVIQIDDLDAASGDVYMGHNGFSAD